jgi:hypothetical protein
MKQVNRGFFSVWNTEMAYILGFWFADGWMSQPDTSCYITFTSADLDHLKAIQSLLASGQKIYARTGRCYDLTIGSKQLWRDLYRLGGRPAKSLIAEMPFVPQELVHHFVRGFVDGDGCLYWNALRRATPRIHIFGGQRFLQQLASVLDQETGVGVAQVRVHKKNVLVLSYPGIKAKVLAKWMYTPGDLALERKAALAQEFGKWELSKFGWKSQTVMTPRMRQILAS